MASGIPPKKNGDKAPEADAEPTYRMSMLPFGTYANPDGTESLGLAMPGMIQEPINALMNLFGSGNFAQGPDYPGNADDMRTLLFSMYGGNALNPVRAAEAIAPQLLSDTGKLSPVGSVIAAESAPQRMYHGTATADDFSHFIPSENGAFGPGVYLSREADSTNPYAFNGPNPRVMPVDVSGPLATYDDYLAARNASPDQAATVQALLDRGFSGVSVDNATPKGTVNVTNVFRPGSVTSPLTGETLFSDGLPSLPGSLSAGSGSGDRNTPASVRYSNPGAQFPGASASKFGSTGYYTLPDGNKIAIFADPEHGAAAQFDLLSRNYVGLPLSDAIKKWSGGNASDAYAANIVKRTGLSPDTVLSPELLSDPTRAIPLAKAMAAHEAGQDYPMTDAQWANAFQLANGGQDVLPQPQVGMLSGMPGIALANPNPNAPQMALPAGLLTGMDMTGQTPQPAPAATPAPAAGNSIMAGLIQGDKDAIAAMPKMDDIQFSAPQRAPVDLSRLVAIAQARQLGSRA